MAMGLEMDSSTDCCCEHLGNQGENGFKLINLSSALLPVIIPWPNRPYDMIYNKKSGLYRRWCVIIVWVQPKTYVVVNPCSNSDKRVH